MTPPEPGLMPSLEQARQMTAFGANPELQHAVSVLANAPQDWERAMTDPATWLKARGIAVPDNLRVEFISEISTPMPLPSGPLGMPGPDWVPFTIQQFNCRKYLLPKRPAVGPVTYEEVTICFGFRIVATPVPGGPRG